MNRRAALALRWTRLRPGAAAARDWRPHDLLLLDAGLDLPGAPPWVAAALARAPLAVVRRAAAAAGVAIGIRGATRTERYGTVVTPGAVLAALAPEHLLDLAPVPARVPALALLDRLRPLFDQHGLRWGPTGSCGFELASGLPSAHAGSDLDLLIRCPRPLPPATARSLLQALAHHAAPHCRIDVQLETPSGAVALADYAHGARMLLRSPDGARLVTDPWAETAPSPLF